MVDEQRQARLMNQYHRIRHNTMQICEGLSAEDMVVQSMTDASPTKWHLAHTTWFFEVFVLQTFYKQHQLFDPDFLYLFNSYYETQGQRHQRANRGLLTRPALSKVLEYRHIIDEQIQRFFNEIHSDEILDVLEVGLHHEMQHQELMLTDILHLLSTNPTATRFKELQNNIPVNGAFRPSPESTLFEGGLVNIGTVSSKGETETDFCYDNETPSHKHYLPPYKLHNHPVTNAEWIEFIADKGYQNPLLWLSDGWDCCRSEQWQAPLYWKQIEGKWFQYSLNGLLPVNPSAPVNHISFYEADAFARWRGKRLPTEQEWEWAAHNHSASIDEGNFQDNQIWQPIPTQIAPAAAPVGLFGNTWEWTASPYIAYPGFKPEQGALGEYNGKFMANQWVLRGGSCVTPKLQIRTTYRNFFYPHQRWQFSGVRLAF